MTSITKLTSLFLLIISQIVWGQSSTPKADVIILDSKMRVKAFDPSNVNVRIVASEPSGTLPEVAALDKMFQDSGLSAYVKTWDQLDRDVLFVTARARSEADLPRIYPGLPRKALSKFKREIISK